MLRVQRGKEGAQCWALFLVLKCWALFASSSPPVRTVSTASCSSCSPRPRTVEKAVRGDYPHQAGLKFAKPHITVRLGPMPVKLMRLSNSQELTTQEKCLLFSHNNRKNLALKQSLKYRNPSSPTPNIYTHTQIHRKFLHSADWITAT